jgi:hypothetical protein
MKILNLVSLIVALSAAGARSARAQSPRPDATDSVGAVGKYDFSFVPQNGEGITGGLTISLRSGRYYGVVTSPKLSEPADADSVRLIGHRVFVWILGGAYTFTFDVDGKTISHAIYMKAMRGTAEQGDLTIRKLSP